MEAALGKRQGLWRLSSDNRLKRLWSRGYGSLHTHAHTCIYQRTAGVDIWDWNPQLSSNKNLGCHRSSDGLWFQSGSCLTSCITKLKHATINKNTNTVWYHQSFTVCIACQPQMSAHRAPEALLVKCCYCTLVSCWVFNGEWVCIRTSNVPSFCPLNHLCYSGNVLLWVIVKRQGMSHQCDSLSLHLSSNTLSSWWPPPPSLNQLLTRPSSAVCRSPRGRLGWAAGGLSLSPLRSLGTHCTL